MYKQVIIMRSDLKLPKGKACAQAAHASSEAVMRTDKEIIKTWRTSGSAKIVLKVQTKEELYEYLQYAKDSNIACALITDAGKTVIAPGTVTCLAIGPDTEEKIDEITSTLKLF